MIFNIRNFIYKLPGEFRNNLTLKNNFRQGNSNKISKLPWKTAWCLTSLAEIYFWHLFSKNTQKQMSNFFVLG